MKLERTTIITGDDKSAAQSLTESLSENEVLFIIVLGTGDYADDAVEAADVRAGVTVLGFKRKVIWVKEKPLFKSFFETDDPLAIGESDFKMSNLDEVAAISVSMDKVIKDVIMATDTIDFFRMETAFLEAGQ
jgi:hypothetical protein